MLIMQSFNNGDRVYYKRRKRSGWSGPATVLGQDGQFVLLVRHGSSCFRVHPCQLIKTCKWELSVINENETSERIPEANRYGNLRVSNLKYKQANSNMEVHEDHVYAADDEDVKNVVGNAEDGDEVDQLVENPEVCDGNNVECDEGPDNLIENVEDCDENDLEAGEDGFTVGDNGRVTSNQGTAEIVEGIINDQPDHVQQENVVSNSLKTYEPPKPNMYIRFKLIGQSEWTKASVLSKQPKRTGKNKVGSTFFKKEMKSPAVWIGSKSVIGKKLYVQRVCC